MADFGTQTDYKPAAKTIELKETTKPIVSKVGMGKFPFIQR